VTGNLSEYVRTLGPAGEPPGPADYDAARELLRADLVRVMVRRGLWSAPPRYLGVEGASHWTRELLDELVSDCYVELFLRRLPALKNQLLARDDVGGVIVRGVRNFLHDLQRDNDPLGYKVYEILRDSLRRLHEAGKLRIVGQSAGKTRIHNGTVCVFDRSGGSGKQVDLEARVGLHLVCHRIVGRLVGPVLRGDEVRRARPRSDGAAEIRMRAGGDGILPGRDDLRAAGCADQC